MKLIKYLAYICLLMIFKNCYGGRSRYLSLEHPKILYNDDNIFSNFILKSRLRNRKDPIHYITFNITSKITLAKNMKFNYYVYQRLSNVYKQSFVELHHDLCYFLEYDQIVGDAAREAYYKETESKRMLSVLKCPLPPGFYGFPDMRMRLSPVIDTFPFNVGRIFGNITVNSKLALNFYIDFELKTLRTK